MKRILLPFFLLSAIVGLASCSKLHKHHQHLDASAVKTRRPLEMPLFLNADLLERNAQVVQEIEASQNTSKAATSKKPKFSLFKAKSKTNSDINKNGPVNNLALKPSATNNASVRGDASYMNNTNYTATNNSAAAKQLKSQSESMKASTAREIDLKAKRQQDIKSLEERTKDLVEKEQEE